MATTYELISTVTVGSGGAASMDFTSIPATWTDLLIKVSGRQASAATTGSLNLTLNGASTAFTYRALQGAGSGTPASFSGSSGYLGQNPAASTTSNTFGNAEIYIANYASGAYKTISSDTVDENNATTTYAQMNAVLWSSTSAITSFSLISGAGNFVQYSSASLYGIKNS